MDGWMDGWMNNVFTHSVYNLFSVANTAPGRDVIAFESKYLRRERN